MSDYSGSRRPLPTRIMKAATPEVGDKDHARRAKKRERTTLDCRVFTSRRRICSVFYRAAVMASVASWWCFYVDNCVQVAAQQVKCSQECDCYNNYKVVNCDSRGLRTLPSFISSPAERLSLGNNKIRALKRNVFRTLENLVTLQLNDNDIRDIPSSVFYDLRSLQQLDLSGNKIIQVPRLALARLSNLQYLALRNNPISQLLAYDFIESRRTLKTLDIGELRRLSYISNQALSGLQNLETLRMDSCQLSNAPTMPSLVNLRQLDLSSNRFSRVSAKTFFGMTRLTTLSLAYCDITEIEDNAFRHLLALESLNLASNNLKTLTYAALPQGDNIRSLQVEANPWLCNCDLLPFVRYIEERRTCSGESCGRCKYPLAYKNMPLLNLTRIDNPPCAGLSVNGATRKSLNASVGDPVKIPCPTLSTVTRKPEVEKIVWFMPNGTSIRHGIYEVRISMLGNGSLNFTHVTLKDTGTYRCAVTRDGSEVAQSSIYLNVTGPNQVVMHTTVLTTETTVYKTTERKVESQNPAPTVYSRAERPWATDAPKTRFVTTQRQQTAFLTTTSSKQLRPVNNYVTDFMQPAFTRPQNTPEQVVETTKIIVGCFVGITLLAAVLLVVFYKLRQRNNESHRYHVRHDHSDHGNSVLRETCDRGSIRQMESTIENQTLTSLNSTQHYTASSTSADTTPTRPPTEMSSVSWNPSGATYHVKPGYSSLPEKLVHVLPPPPEELKFATLDHRSSSNNNRVTSRNAGSQQSGSQTLPNRPPKQLLSNIAASCQQVALQRRSVHGCIPEDGEPIISARTPINGNNSNALNHNNAKVYHRSCDNLKKPSFSTYPSGDSEIPRMQDIDLSKALLTRELRSVRPGEAPKRKIPIRMRSLEGLLNHKETEI